MMFLGWITTGQRTPPPLIKAAELSDTEAVAQAQSKAHHLPDPTGHEEQGKVAQGLRLRFDERLTTNLAGLLSAHPTVYAGAQKDADELREQLAWRSLSERMLNTFRSLHARSRFGLLLRQAYVAQRTDEVMGTIQTLHEAAQAAGAVPNDLAAVRAGVWPNYERLNQRSQLGVSAAAAQRGDGAAERRDWRGYAQTLADRLAVLDARLREERGQAAAGHVVANKAPSSPEATRKARR